MSKFRRLRLWWEIRWRAKRRIDSSDQFIAPIHAMPVLNKTEGDCRPPCNHNKG